MFKTIYFPAERTRDGKPRRLCISLPGVDSENHDASTRQLAEEIAKASSLELRRWLGDPYIEDLASAAEAEGRSVSNYCARVFTSRVHENGHNGDEQLPLPLVGSKPQLQKPVLGVTFQDSKKRPFHRWYPYVEGFSAQYVGEVLDRFGSVRSIFDPFGGAGTTQVEASARGLSSSYCEVNPFMRFVAECKVNAAQEVSNRLAMFDEVVGGYRKELRSSAFRKRSGSIDLMSYYRAFPNRDFFDERHLRDLMAARDLAIEMSGSDAAMRDLLLLAVAANTVRSSHMTRRADLRRRRPDEYKRRVVDVVAFIEEKLCDMCADLRGPYHPRAPMLHLADDCRSPLLCPPDEIDLALTSPPYLNGTNYFRNTKLEMWLLGFLESEQQLPRFAAGAVAAGINNVSRDHPREHRFDAVEHVVAELEATDGDRRIPLLVRYYFSDMFDVFRSVRTILRPGGRFVLDIGDSKFYGVHVPTDRLLREVAECAGFEFEDERYLARRLSYDKSELRQVELVLRCPVGARTTRTPRDEAGHQDASPALTIRTSTDSANRALLRHAVDLFADTLPYTRQPFSKRSWGHTLHSLSCYQGKMKPAIAHWLVRIFSEPGMMILDPLGGVGTVAFEACLAGRRGWTNDLSPFPYAVATGKVRAPSRQDVKHSIQRLEEAIDHIALSAEDYSAAEFGLNGSVRDFYHTKTLGEVLRARVYFSELTSPSDADLFLKASLLHVLHGNRPYALSRTSHPITPFHPTGPRNYRPLIPALRARVDAVRREPLPSSFVRGWSTQGDFRRLAGLAEVRVDRVITSPPFWGMRFDRPNWLRLWFCGWGAEDFHKRSLSFLERQQTQSLSVYADFFRACRSLLREDGLMILHLGGSDKHQMLEELIELSRNYFHMVGIASEDVSKLERHGIKDKGLTTTHNFLFLQPAN